jgi:transposase
VPLTFWDGFQGYIHVDGYAGYHKLEEKKQMLLVNCMAHARRKFTEVAKLSKKKHGVSHEVIKRIAALYKIEKILREKEASIEEIKTTRQEKSKPILASLKTYLEEKQAGVLPKSQLGQAISYTLAHWVGLNRYLEDGRLEIDNNHTERVIKPFATGRKNWLFSDSVKGANASANIYSLIETCKFHGINPYDYLKYVFSEIRKCETVEHFEKLLPYRFHF